MSAPGQRGEGAATRYRVPASEVASVYRQARDEARLAWVPVLRWRERRLVQRVHLEDSDTLEMARWAAVRDELTARGEPTLSYSR